jgi:beta-galactosidase
VPANPDTGSDWWVWAHDPDNIADGRVSGDLPEQGPAFYNNFASDIRLARRRLNINTFRSGLEWSRIFPVSTAAVDITGGVTLADLQALDVLADQAEVLHYRAVLTAIRDEGLQSSVTLSHFSLPLWIHDPIAARDAFGMQGPDDPVPTGFPGGWVHAVTIVEFEKYAAFAAWKFGDLVDTWAPLNEPFSVTAGGYANIPGIIGGNFPPGAFSFTGAITCLLNQARAQGKAYDAIPTWDTTDANGDSVPAQVGLVHNMIAFHPLMPGDAEDAAGAAHADYIYNRLYLEATIHGDVDENVNGMIDPGEHDPALAGSVDFIGVNYYFRAKTQGLGVSITPTIPLLDFLPVTGYMTPQAPSAPPCPTSCTEFGWEIYPQGLHESLVTVGAYGLPVYITENGLADSNDDQRKRFIVQHLTVLEQAIANNVADVRGYYHWSLTDNFEWASGYYPRFGLFSYDPVTQKRRMRKSARIYSRIVRRNTVPEKLSKRYPL